MGLKITSWGATEAGRSRDTNEDCFLLAPELGLVIVADGMGGPGRGDVAAELACTVVKEYVHRHRHVLALHHRSPGAPSKGAIRAMLTGAVQQACREIHDAAVALRGDGAHMGTTLDVLLVVGTTGFIAHVGDGRILLIRGGEVHRLTTDHALTQTQLSDGGGDSVDVKGPRITRALGPFFSAEVDGLDFELDRGDRLLVCTDGLHRAVSDDELAQRVGRDVVSDETVASLIATASARNEVHNATAVLSVTDPEMTGEFIAPTRQRMEVLRRCELFQFCTYRELMTVCQVAESRSVLQDAVLFEEGDLGRECFVIVEGRVAIESSGVRLAILESGNIFGEMSFIDQPRRSAQAIALTDCDFLIIRRDRFLQLIKQDGDLAVKMMWQLLKKLSGIVRDANAALTTERNGGSEDR